MICPYCKQEIPSKDFALKTPEGNYWHFPCADMALDEWVKLKEKNEKLEAVAEAADMWAKELMLHLRRYTFAIPSGVESNLIRKLQDANYPKSAEFTAKLLTGKE